MSIIMEGPGRNDPVVASENVESQAMITFRAGYSATRQPVEIDQNSLGTYVPSSEEETATSYDVEGQSDTHDLVAPLLDGSASTDSRRSCWTRLLAFFVARHRSLIGIVLIVLFYIISTRIGSLENKKHTKDSHFMDMDRPSQVLDCARVLSRGIGLSDNERNQTSQWQAANWFIGGSGIQIGVPEPCHWSSSFGIAYGIIVIRESLGVVDRSWHDDGVIDGQNPLRKICRWKRIKCNVDKTSILELTLNHAQLNRTIPAEVMGFTDLKVWQMENNEFVFGKIPPELGHLTQLNTLLLQRTQLSGTIPTSLGSLSFLQDLHMDHVRLFGTMPSEICDLRKQNLRFLTSNCDTDKPNTPFVRCDRATCCTYCG